MTILELRKYLGLSQSEFAKRFHLTKKAVQSWEQGWRKTPESYLFLIARVIELEEQVIELKGLEYNDT